MGRHGGRPSLDRFPGCKGLQPSKVNNGLRGPDHDLEGAGPSAPRSSIENFVWFVAVRHELEGVACDEAPGGASASPPSYRFPGCEEPQPSKSITTIKAL